MAKRLLACLLTICMLLSSGLAYAAPSDSQSKGEKESMLTFSVGSARMKVDVCAADILHVRWAPGGTLPDKGEKTFTVDNDDFDSFDDYTVTEAGNVLTVTTDKLRVAIDKSTGKVTYRTADGQLILAEGDRAQKSVTLTYSKNAPGETENKSTYEIGQSFASDDNEALYGFGNINNTMGIKGQTIEIAQSNTNKRTPMFYSNMGYGILFDIVSNGRLTWSNSNKTYTYTGLATDSMDYYFYYGPDADTVISGYRQTTGTATMLPKNAFGYVQSRNRYSSQKQLLEIMETFQQKQIPLDTLVIDYYWWTNDKNGGGVFNNISAWNAPNWPDPAAMMETLHNNHITASISVWPTFQPGPDDDPNLARKELADNGFILPTGSGFGDTYDPTTQAARSIYWKWINQTVYSKGLDSIWLDADEPENSAWTRNNASDPTQWGDSKMIGAMYPLLTNQGVYEGQRAINNGKRVNTLTRGAVAGVQRYGGQSWSGDIQSTWESLTNEVSGVVNYSAAGLPYFCTDTGGYHGFNNADPDGREMYLRWLQFSTFNTIMRSHGAGNPREPWQFGETYESYITDYINLRERLVPYIYSLAGAVTQDDYTIVRPLIFDFRTDNNVKNIKDQFMFGSELMVCPVTKSGQRSRNVYLPAGKWINFWTGETIDSTGETVKVAAPLRRIPLFVRAGSILPMGPENQYVDENQDPTEIRVYMGADGQFNLYEDEGNTYNYENGQFSNIPFTYDEESQTLTIGERTGEFDGMLQNRTFNVVFVQNGYGTGEAISEEYQKTATVAYDGSAKTVTFDPAFEPPIPALDTDSIPTPDAAPTVKTSERAQVGYWAFDNTEGGRVIDDSGYTNNGLLNDTGNWVDEGKFGHALSFNGESTFVTVPDKDSLDMTQQISFSTWAKNESNGYGNILNKGGNGNNNPGYSFILTGGVNLQLEIQSPLDANKKTQKTTAKGNKPLPKDGQWHQVGFTWKSTAAGGDGIVRFYLDGVQVSDDNNAANVFNGPIGTNSYPLNLGRSCDNEPNAPNYFKGSLDETHLYNYALTAAEMQALYQNQNILLPDVTNAAVQPGDGKLTITWTDAATTDKVKLRVESVDPDFSEHPYDQTFTLDKGVQEKVVDSLQNGEYYYVSLVSVDAQGKEAAGVNLIGYPATLSAEIDTFYIATQGQNVYGYITNHASTELPATLTITLKGVDNTVLETKTITVKVGGNDSALFQQALQTSYAEGQTLTFSLKDTAGNLLAQETTVKRTNVYDPVPLGEKQELQKLLEFTMDPTLYTETSVNAYNEAYRNALRVYRNGKATEEEVKTVVDALKEAQKGLRRNPNGNDAIVAHFSQSEKTITTQQGGNIFYNDWSPADGAAKADQPGSGINCAGLAENGADENLHFRATIVFDSLNDEVEAGNVWNRLRFRFRSSNKDGNEQACGFYTIYAKDIARKDFFDIDIPLSAIPFKDDEANGIDWSDLKELIVQCFVNDEYRLTEEGESPHATFTMRDVWIENVGPSGWTNKVALEIALNSRLPAADLVGYTTESVEAYNQLYDDAQAVYNNANATSNDYKSAMLTLNGAEKNLVKDETYQDPNLVATLIDGEKTMDRENHYMSISETLNTPVNLSGYADEELMLSYELRLNVTSNLPDITSVQEWLPWVRNGRVQLWSAAKEQITNDNGVSVGGDQNGQIHATKNELTDMVPGKWVRVTVPLPQAIADAGQITKYSFFLYNDLHNYNGWSQDVGLTLSARDVKIVKKAANVNKDNLQEAIQSANNALNSGKVYADTTALRAALINANQTYNDPIATQEIVDAETTALRKAIDGLAYILGDVNGDGNVDIIDALMALQKAAEKIELAPIEAKAANVDNEGTVTAADALLILKAATKQIAHF